MYLKRIIMVLLLSLSCNPLSHSSDLAEEAIDKTPSNRFNIVNYTARAMGTLYNQYYEYEIEDDGGFRNNVLNLINNPQSHLNFWVHGSMHFLLLKLNDKHLEDVQLQETAYNFTHLAAALEGREILLENQKETSMLHDRVDITIQPK